MCRGRYGALYTWDLIGLLFCPSLMCSDLSAWIGKRRIRKMAYGGGEVQEMEWREE